jgi:mannose-1-phosphate guanylyltransferase/mannose-6-phosphate isomerase
MSTGKIVPVILSGGTGTRLWPLSRTHYPKQLQPLTSERSMLQETAVRVSDDSLFGRPLIVASSEHRFIIAEQMRQIGVDPRGIMLEPVARNTAPAAAAAALSLMAEDPDALMLVLPSDHIVQDVDAFRGAVAMAAGATARGALVTFGITPHAPETGYGYIRRGPELENAAGCFQVSEFVEKPPLAKAEGYIASGGWFWNGGIFLFSAAAFLKELERLRPATLVACREAVRLGGDDLGFFRLDNDTFAATPAESIDCAVMEHTAEAAVVPVDMGWNDIGSWSALWETGTKDSQGNVLVGDVMVRGVRNSYLRTDGRLVTAIGLEDVVIVANSDTVLAVSKEQVQEVGELVEELRTAGRSESVVHPLVYRPWGSYEKIDAGGGFLVKRITVNPGASLSLQKHERRAEHWVVVGGTAKVTRGDKIFLLRANESTYIPAGTLHRLENPEIESLQLIEIQTGDYLGEDDIVRLSDRDIQD